MAKDKEREVARKLFVELGKSQKEIADDLGLTEKTVSTWVSKYNWREQRDALLNNTKNRAEKIKAVIEALTDNSLIVQEKIKDAEAKGDLGLSFTLKKEASSIADQVGKYQKALEKLDKDFKVSLSTYLEVMEDIFEALQNYDRELFFKTIDFQKSHIQSIAQTLG